VIEPPSESGEKMQSILSGPTPASISAEEVIVAAQYNKDQYSSEGFGHGGPSGVVENPIEINQNHPKSPIRAKVEQVALLESNYGNNERPEAPPAAVESEMGQILNKVI
jgi:hypothetical protein